MGINYEYLNTCLYESLRIMSKWHEFIIFNTLRNYILNLKEKKRIMYFNTDYYILVN